MHVFKLTAPGVRPNGLDTLLAGRSTVVALGNFDGVHLAHRRILECAIEEAAVHGALAAVFTFEQSKPPYITTFRERLALFESAGIELVFAADFDAFKGQAPDAFFYATLIGTLAAKGVSCGFNFRFGHMAAGDGQLLLTLCAREGLVCRISPPIEQCGRPISSTEIRKSVTVGDLASAESMLGRPYSLSGEVVHGRAVGRQMNCPTMNLSIAEGRLLPPFGVYFTRCIIDGTAHPAVTNIGIRPTFGLTEVSCESYLLSASGDFYGKPLTVVFEHFRRPEEKFADPASLMQAIASDTEAAKQYFHL